MYEVHIGYRYVSYSEGEGRELTLGWDWGGTADSFWIDVPSESSWRRRMPPWARRRREEILERIRESTAHMRFREQVRERRGSSDSFEPSPPASDQGS